jgi:L-alanine-DL-glutamate epimerase-like enolase superfamily enzyme
MRISLEKINLDLKVNWKLSRNQTTFKENYIVHLKGHDGHFRSEIAPNIRYGETVQNINEEFENWYQNIDLKSIKTIDQISKILSAIKLHSLRFGLESVLLSFLAKRNGISLSHFLGLPSPREVETSFTMPIIPVHEIETYLKSVSRFKSLKIKVNAETGEEMLKEIRRYSSARLRVDANEGWRDLDQFLKFEETLHGMNIELIEQPFPSSMVAEYKELKKITPYKLLADESIEDVGDFQELSKQFHSVNIKLMKTGSLLKARELIIDAKKYGLKSMMGCMIETTIGISYGMLFGGMVDYVDLDGFLLIKDEPFHLVNETEGILKLS